MRTSFAILGALLAVSVGFQSVADAQVPQFTTGPQTGGGGPSLRRSSRPVVSAYAGLLGTGSGGNSSFGYQYFTRVQPQLTAERALGSLGRSVNRLQSQAQSGTLTGTPAQLPSFPTGVDAGIGPTGHATGYLNHLAYFGTNSGRNGSSSSASGTRGSMPGTAAPSANGPQTATPVRRY